MAKPSEAIKDALVKETGACADDVEKILKRLGIDAVRFERAGGNISLDNIRLTAIDQQI